MSPFLTNIPLSPFCSTEQCHLSWPRSHWPLLVQPSNVSFPYQHPTVTFLLTRALSPFPSPDPTVNFLLKGPLYPSLIPTSYFHLSDQPSNVSFPYQRFRDPLALSCSTEQCLLSLPRSIVTGALSPFLTPTFHCHLFVSTFSFPSQHLAGSPFLLQPWCIITLAFNLNMYLFSVPSLTLCSIYLPV